jgi:hypothetical protein
MARRHLDRRQLGACLGRSQLLAVVILAVVILALEHR